jgi:hypothetical protein
MAEAPRGKMIGRPGVPLIGRSLLDLAPEVERGRRERFAGYLSKDSSFGGVCSRLTMAIGHPRERVTATWW